MDASGPGLGQGSQRGEAPGPSVHHLIDRGLLVAGARDDELVVDGDVAAQHRRGLFGLQGGESRVSGAGVKPGKGQLEASPTSPMPRRGGAAGSCLPPEEATAVPSPTWKMLAPYGVLQALSRLSFPVLTNHLPVGGEPRSAGPARCPQAAPRGTSCPRGSRTMGAASAGMCPLTTPASSLPAPQPRARAHGVPAGSYRRRRT